MKRKNSDPDQESVDSNRKREIIGPNEDIDSESKKQKKVRTTFTGRQIFELEKMFETKKYLSSSERTELAKMLNVTEQQVIHLSSFLWGPQLTQNSLTWSPLTRFLAYL